MNEETEKIILESLRMLLWENHRKWNSINLQHGGGWCVETEEIEELVKKINKVLNPIKQPSIAERTHDAFSKEDLE